MISKVWIGTQNPFFSVSQSLFNLYKIFWQIISHLLSVPVHTENSWLLVSVILPALVTEISSRSTGSDSELPEGAMESWQQCGTLYKPSVNENSVFRVRGPGVKNIGNKSSLSDSFPHGVYVL